jgi:hypothetical protein
MSDSESEYDEDVDLDVGKILIFYFAKIVCVLILSKNLCFIQYLRFTDDLFSEYKSMLEEQEMNSGFYPDSDQDEDDDYDSDPPATLPKLTKQHEYKFRELPSQLFQHLMLDRKRKFLCRPWHLFFFFCQNDISARDIF